VTRNLPLWERATKATGWRYYQTSRDSPLVNGLSPIDDHLTRPGGAQRVEIERQSRSAGEQKGSCITQSTREVGSSHDITQHKGWPSMGRLVMALAWVL
jgi:hypothetical protein